MSQSRWRPQLPLYRKYKDKLFNEIAQTGQFIHQIGESSLLRKPSKAVPISEIPSSEFQKKVQYLKTCMRKYRKITGLGRGITAVQVGIPERFAVIFISEKDSGQSQNDIISTKKRESFLIIINPKITKTSKTLVRYPEVCMSANPLIAPVIRPSWIEFEYYGEDGKKHLWNTKDKSKQEKLYNRVFQHEIDHMNGIINIDRVQSKELSFELDPLFYEKATFQKVSSKKRPAWRPASQRGEQGRKTTKI